jgi:hypothetical protein
MLEVIDAILKYLHCFAQFVRCCMGRQVMRSAEQQVQDTLLLPKDEFSLHCKGVAA